MIFTPADRDRLRTELVAAAAADGRITGVALFGSAALDRQDRWSDIDLAFGVGGDTDPVVGDWTDRMYGCGAVAHTDMRRDAVLYRVFLLANTLQVDLAFAPETQFGAVSPSFRLLHGTAVERTPVPPPAVQGLAGMGWLYALHARSSIERGRPWQAEYMVSGVRDQALALACRRHRLPASEGRGLDRLPDKVLARAEGTLIRSTDPAELRRAFRAATELLLTEIATADPALAGRIGAVVRTIADGQDGTE